MILNRPKLTLIAVAVRRACPAPLPQEFIDSQERLRLVMLFHSALQARIAKVRAAFNKEQRTAP